MAGSPSRALLAWLLASLGWLGCDGDDGAPDTGTPADSGIGFDASTPEIAPPTPPNDVVITPCPSGWAEVAGDVTTCEPWPLDAPPSCAVHEARFVGDESCARIGSACPADGWPADLPPEASVRFVRAGATGDGTRASPFGTIAEAISGATSGTTIAVAVGAYDESLDVPEGVSVVGACVEGTIVSSDAAAIDRGVFTVVGADVSIRDLTIGPSQQGGIFAVGAGRSVTVRDVVIRDVRSIGIDLEHGAVFDGENVAIRGVTSTATGLFGRGMTVENGAEATLRRLVIEDTSEFGILALEATVSLEDAWITRTSPLPSGVAGAGLVAWRGGTVTGLRVVVDANVDAGIAARDGSLDFELALVRGTEVRPEMDRGRGISVEGGSTLGCRRCVLEDNHELGLLLDGMETVGTLRDLVIRRTNTVLGGSFGRAIGVQSFADLDLERAMLTDNAETTILVGGLSPGTASIRDLVVRRGRVAERVGQARGITVQNGSTVTMDRILFEELSESALIVGDEGSSATVSDLLIRNVDIVEGPTPLGRGVAAQSGGSVQVSRARIEDVHDLGMAVLRGARIDASDVVIEGVRELSCPPGTFCVDAPGGHGIAAYVGATLSLTRFSVTDAQICGVHVAADGTAILDTGLVTGSAIGACVQSETQAIEDLQNDVRYLDNGRALDATSLPVPDVVARSEGST